MIRRLLFLLLVGGCDALDPIVAGDGGQTNDATLEASADAEVETGDGSVDDGGTEGGSVVTCDGGVLGLQSVTPAFGWYLAPNAVTIDGQGFHETPTVDLLPVMVPDGGVVRPLGNVAFQSGTTLTGEVPAGIAPGVYDVRLRNPDDCTVILPKAYTAVGNPPPVVLAVSPGTGTIAKDTPVVVTGCHFPNNATLQTVSPTSVVVSQTVQNVSCSGGTVPECNNTPPCTMNAIIHTQTKMLAPGPYVVRVANPNDATYDDWSAFVVTDPSGKLTGMWTPASSLVVGRRSLQAVSGSIDSAHRFLYAVGGEDGSGAPLDSVEVAPVDAFGKLGKWFVQKAKLGTARAGLALVRRGRYLWAIGGTASANGTGGTSPSGVGLSTIERAKILDPANAPVLAAPTTSLAGTLGKGTWYYRVSAVLSNADPDNPSGETLASSEKAVVLGAAGSITTSWSSVTNAAHYRVYRSPMANGTSGSEVLLKDNVAQTSFVDDGTATPGAETPVLLGSTGTWQSMGTLAVATFDATAVIAPESSAPNAPLHVYVLGGWGKCTNTTAAMTCHQYASMSAAGDAIGAFTLNTTHATQKGRFRFGSTAVTSINGPPFFTDGGGPNTASFVLIGGGAGIASVASTVEYALVGAGGVLGTWGSATGFAQQRDGTQVAMVNGYGYAFFGGPMNGYTSTSDLSTNAEATPSSIAFLNWSNAGVQLPYAVGRHGLAMESAYFYVVGGTKDDKDALTNVYQIIY